MLWKDYRLSMYAVCTYIVPTETYMYNGISDNALRLQTCYMSKVSAYYTHMDVFSNLVVGILP